MGDLGAVGALGRLVGIILFVGIVIGILIHKYLF